LAGALGLAVWAGYLLLTLEPGRGSSLDSSRRVAATGDPRALRGSTERHETPAPQDHIGSESREALLEILRESDSGDDRGEAR
jgi:hypothetical protein